MPLSVQVHRIVKERKEKGEYIPLHTHPFFHCVYIISGRGRVQIAEQTVEARRGLFLRIAPRVEHAIFGEDAMQSFDIKFSAQGALLAQLESLPLAMALDAYEHNLVMSIFRLAIQQEAYAEPLINTRMTELLLLLLRREKQRPDAPAPLAVGAPVGACATLYPALAYMEQHPDQMPSVAFLAEQCGYTPAYFSTAFKRAFGCGPSRYLREKKVELAREEMLTADCTVAELAQRVGMDAASFSRLFKKVTGISPSQYLTRANSDVGINISPDSPYLPAGAFEIPKQC